MAYLENIFYTLFPVEKIKNTPWELDWEATQRREFLTSVRIFYPISAVIYLLHYFYVDIPQNLQPLELWFRYRFSMALLGVTVFGFYLVPSFYQTKFYRLPSMLAAAIFCYFQTRTIIWYPEVPYLYSFVFIFITVMVQKLSLVKSVGFGLLLGLIQYPTFMQIDVSKTMLASAFSVTIICIIFMKSKILTEVEIFLNNKHLLLAQKKIIELNVEFNEEIKSFLPRKIHKKIVEYIKNERFSTVQAMDEVLRPRVQQIACLYSDIRGYTQQSKDLAGFTFNHAIPDIKETVNAVEDCNGVPRIIGDLVMAYFNDDQIEINILDAIWAGIIIREQTNRLNLASKSGRVHRFIIITCGEAVVGNIGGLDSREITALGSPVNFASRIDEITKREELRQQMADHCILMSPEVVIVLNRIGLHECVERISLNDLNVSIRDFPQVSDLYFLKISSKLKNLIQEKRSSEIDNQVRGEAV